MNIQETPTLYPIERLRTFSINCLIKVGVAPEKASQVAESLAAADIRGKETHGIARLKRYVDGCAKGTIDPCVEPVRVVDLPALALLDAKNGLGQPAAIMAMNLAIEKADQAGVAIVAVRNTNHFGIAGYYAGLAAARGLIGIAASNASPQVAPTYGARPMFGTNPLAVAVPVGGSTPFLLDMATSVVPRGKLERMYWYDTPIPEGWAIDPLGQPATEKESLIQGLKNREGHAILPLGGAGENFGGHKGYGLGILLDLLCGPMTGSLWGRRVYGNNGAQLGQFFLAIKVEAFLALSDFYETSAQFIEDLKNTPLALGCNEVFIPGEKSKRIEKIRLIDGVPLPSKVQADLQRLSERYGVAF